MADKQLNNSELAEAGMRGDMASMQAEAARAIHTCHINSNSNSNSNSNTPV